MIVMVLQKSTRCLLQILGHPTILLLLREIVIRLVLVLFLRFPPQGLLHRL